MLAHNIAMGQVESPPQGDMSIPPPINNTVLSKYTLSNISISDTGTSLDSSQCIPNIRHDTPGASDGTTNVGPSSGATSPTNSIPNHAQQSHSPSSQGQPSATIASTQNLPYLRKKAENDPKIKAELVSILSSTDISDQKKTEMLKAMMDGASPSASGPSGGLTNGPTSVEKNTGCDGDATSDEQE